MFQEEWRKVYLYDIYLIAMTAADDPMIDAL